MLYLEDYIEMIEHLPRELRDGFTELREIDLQVHNSSDTLDERARTFFGNARKMRSQERDAEFESIRKGYYKTLEECDEKVDIADQLYSLVDRYLRRLDQELHKFKLELEADNAGITELLERRSLDLDAEGASAAGTGGSTGSRSRAVSNGPASVGHDWQKENRGDTASSALTRRNHDRKTVLSSSQPSRRDDRVSLMGGASSARHHHSSTNHNGHQSSPSLTSSAFGSLATPGGGCGNSAVAAAASQAIAATQHIQQGRRTTSAGSFTDCGYPDNVFVCGSGGGGAGSSQSGEFGVARELAGAAHAALLSSGLTSGDRRKRKSTSARPLSVSPCPSDDAHPAHLHRPGSHPHQLLNEMILEEPVASAVDEDHWLYDANEPRYCVCQNVSYGDMVACDNRECPYEWFHYACVGITAPPKGKWYCPQCTVSMKRRRQK